MKKYFRLKNFSISFFAPVLGFAGFSLALQKAEELFNLPSWISIGVLGFTISIFIIVLGIYFLKFLFFKKEIAKEYNHPIKINFFPLISKVLLVLSVVFLSLDLTISKWLLVIGIVLNTILSIHILGEWISKEHFKIHHISPAWFIPVVGNLIIPISGVIHFPAEISWFFFSAGVTWMLILTTIVINRIIFHEPLAKKLMPTLFILFAAPAIAFIAYYKLTGGFDAFAHILYYFAAFLFVLIFSQWKMFSKIEFYLSWWAYTFPLAAFFLSTVLMFHITEILLFKWLSLAVLIVLSIFILVLIGKTARAIGRKELCVEE